MHRLPHRPEPTLFQSSADRSAPPSWGRTPSRKYRHGRPGPCRYQGPGRDADRPARHTDNICNRGLRGRGLERVISQDLRSRLLADAHLREELACAVRQGLVMIEPGDGSQTPAPLTGQAGRQRLQARGRRALMGIYKSGSDPQGDQRFGADGYGASF